MADLRTARGAQTGQRAVVEDFHPQSHTTQAIGAGNRAQAIGASAQGSSDEVEEHDRVTEDQEHGCRPARANEQCAVAVHKDRIPIEPPAVQPTGAGLELLEPRGAPHGPQGSGGRGAGLHDQKVIERDLQETGGGGRSIGRGVTASPSISRGMV